MWGTIGRRGVRLIDRALQRRLQLSLISDDPACILRIAPGVSARAVTLRDGARIARGEPILELHFWNERLPALPPGGATLAWAVDVARRAQYSLRLLADYIEREPKFNSIRAVHAEMGFLEGEHLPEMGVLVEHLGFEFLAGQAPGWRFWKYAYWENLFSWWLMWTFNPTSLTGKHFAKMARSELWLSRATLMRNFQSPGDNPMRR